MLKPHLLLTILIFALIGGLAAHYAAQGRFSWPSKVSVPANIPNAPASSNASGSAGASKTSGSPGGGATLPDIGPKGPPANNPIRLPGDGGSTNGGGWGGNSGGWGGNDTGDDGRSANSDRGGYGRNVPGQFDYYAPRAVVEPDLLRREGLQRRHPMQSEQRPPLCFRVAWPLAAIRARLPVGMPARPPSLRAGAGPSAACSISCRAAA